MYLLTAKDQPGYDLVSPTLVSIPAMETDETLHYDIKVEPKHTPRPAEHTAPQTGLFDATIWYVAGGVLLLVLAGGLVIAAKRYEKNVRDLWDWPFCWCCWVWAAFDLAYREQEPFQEIKVKGVGVTETGGTGGGQPGGRSHGTYH